MHSPRVGKCPVLASYQMWFCQKLLKNAINNSKVVRIWRFFEKPHLVLPKLSTSGSLISISMRTGSWGFWRYQMWISQKSPKLHYFTVIFHVFEQFLAKPHLVARQNRTIWTFSKNMSGTESFTSLLLNNARIFFFGFLNPLHYT